MPSKWYRDRYARIGWKAVHDREGETLPGNCVFSRMETLPSISFSQRAWALRLRGAGSEGEYMDILSSNSFLMLEGSLSYLWTKQAAIADNISNAETPGYREKVVTFEDSLTSKLKMASQGTAPVKAMRQVLESTPFSVTEQTVQTRMDDNGVNVTAQMSEAIRNAYQMRYVMSSMNSELGVLNLAIRGQ